MKKWKFGLIVGSGVIVSGLASAVLFNGIAHGEWDFPGLQQQVQHVTEVTDNHEGRITNLETKANTPSDQPTPTPVVVTQVVTQAAAPAPVSASAPTVLAAEATPVPVVPSVVYYNTHGYTCNGVHTVSYDLHWSDGTMTKSDTRPTTGDEASADGTSCATQPLGN